MVKSKRYQMTDDANSAIDSYENDNSSLAPTDNAIGKLAKTRERIVPLNIFEITPDPLQPRRAMPSAVRQAWHFDVTEDGMTRLFSEWIAISADEALIDYEEMSYFVEQRVMGGDIDEESELPVGDIGSNLIALSSLAGDIRAHGLTNPISVYRGDGGYNIETGERRWLAYHLLWIIDQSSDWSKVPARTMDSFSVWRQAGENSVRSELNAISKARQLALLLMDLYGVSNFKQIHEFEHEQDFYAQVADGNEWRVPRGSGEKLVSAMGLQHPRQLRQYRSILRIPIDMWVLADDQNWTERRIRDAISGVIQDDTVTTVTVSNDLDAVLATAEADEPTQQRSRVQQNPLPGFDDFDRNVNYLRGIWKRGEAMDAGDAKRRAVQLIQLLQEFIDQVGD